jgi:hypothetical protein
MMRSHALTIALALIGLALSMPLFELEERLQENFEIDSQAWLRGSGARCSGYSGSRVRHKPAAEGVLFRQANSTRPLAQMASLGAA